MLLLSLGIGSATAVFSVLDTVLLRALPIEAPEELGVLWRFKEGSEVPFGEVSFLDYLDLRSETDTLEALDAFGATPSPGVLRLQSLVVRTRSDPLHLVGAIRREIRALDPQMPLARVDTLRAVVARQRAPWRFNATLFAVFATVAGLMTAAGIFGVVSRTVRDRLREIGLRLALGARPPQVVGLMVWRGMLPAMLGLGIGVVAALTGSHLIAGLLYGITANDPTTYLLVGLLIGGVALLACYLPARRAAQVDPAVTLRHE